MVLGHPLNRVKKVAARLFNKHSGATHHENQIVNPVEASSILKLAHTQLNVGPDEPVICRLQNDGQWECRAALANKNDKRVQV